MTSLVYLFVSGDDFSFYFCFYFGDGPDRLSTYCLIGWFASDVNKVYGKSFLTTLLLGY